MLLQIVVVFRISLQFTCICGCLLGFNPFSQGAPFSPSFFNRSNIRCKEEEKEKERKKGSAQTKAAQKSMELNNDPRVKNISMKTTSICSKMVQKVLH